MKQHLITGLIFLSGIIQAQTVTLQECYDAAYKNYPLQKQKQLLMQSDSLNRKNINTARLPQFEVNGQTTLQSSTFTIPIGMNIPGYEPPIVQKDQYKLSLDVNQVIYDGRSAKQQMQLQTGSSLIDQQKNEVELYKLKEKINLYFFSIMLTEKNLKIIQLTREDLKARIDKTNAGIAGGTALQSSADLLKSELIRLRQRELEIEGNHRTAIAMLNFLTGMNNTAATKFQWPEFENISETDISKRPELTLFQMQKSQNEMQLNLNKTKTLPKVYIFGQGIYGNPVFDVFKNEFTLEWLAGIRFKWDILNWNNNKRDRQITSINRSIIENQKSAFETNTKLQLIQQQEEIVKFEQLIETDNELIQLRENIIKSYEAQLDNGLITPSEYITEFQSLLTARENKELHSIQLMMSKSNYLIISGN